MLTDVYPLLPAGVHRHIHLRCAAAGRAEGPAGDVGAPEEPGHGATLRAREEHVQDLPHRLHQVLPQLPGATQVLYGLLPPLTNLVPKFARSFGRYHSVD